MNKAEQLAQDLARAAEKQFNLTQFSLSPEGSGKNYKTFCPIHEDRANPSLSVWLHSDGNVRATCKTLKCQGIVKVCTELGIWPNPPKGSKRDDWIPQDCAPTELVKFPATWPPCFIKDKATKRWLEITKKPDRIWTIRKETGGPIYQFVCRFNMSDGSKEMRPMAWCHNKDGTEGWQWRKTAAQPVPLYGEDLLAAQATWDVLVVEGEKTADAANRLIAENGFEIIAVTSAFGAQGFEDANWEALKGRRRVLFWADADASKAGEKYINNVGVICANLGCATYRVDNPEGLPNKWDIADWYEPKKDAGPLPEGFDPLALLLAAQEWTPTFIATTTTKLPPDKFFAFLPTHQYIFRPSGELWNMAGVNDAVDGEIRWLQGKDKEVFVPASKLIAEQFPIHQMSWYPGKPEVLEDTVISQGGINREAGVRVYNLYRPSTLVPLEGNVSLWLDHLNEIYPFDAEHILDFMAHRKQFPGEKINHALVLGGEPGIGKDTILEPLRRAVGLHNWADIAPEKIFAAFNGYRQSVVLVISEVKDLGEHNRWNFYEKTKTLMASPPETLEVNTKNVKEYYILNVTSPILTTNNKIGGLYLPPEDRRHYVAWSEATKEQFTVEYWDVLWGSYANGGYEAIAYYLNNRDLSKFNAKATPFQTEAFWQMCDVSIDKNEVGLADVLDHLGVRNENTGLVEPPGVVTVAKLRLTILSNPIFSHMSEWIDKDRAVPRALDGCGYRAIKNRDAKDGRWKLGATRHPVYARKNISEAQAILLINSLKSGNKSSQPELRLVNETRKDSDCPF